MLHNPTLASLEYNILAVDISLVSVPVMSETESEDGGQMQSIATRISCLNQMFMGRSPSAAIQSLAGRESLMDALLGLYNECNNTHFMRNQYISSFVKKCK